MPFPLLPLAASVLGGTALRAAAGTAVRQVATKAAPAVGNAARNAAGYTIAGGQRLARSSFGKAAGKAAVESFTGRAVNGVLGPQQQGQQQQEPRADSFQQGYAQQDTSWRERRL